MSKNKAGVEVIGSILLVMIVVLFVGIAGGYYLTQTQDQDPQPFATIDFDIYENTENGETMMFMDFTVESFERGDQLLIIYQPKDPTKETRYRYFGLSGEQWTTAEPSNTPPNGASPGDSLRFPHDPGLYDPSGPRLEDGDIFYIIGITDNGTRSVIQEITYKDPDSL